MIITEALPGKKGLVKLILDDGRAVYIDEQVQCDGGIGAGMQLSEDELNALISASNDRRAYENALYILELRAHSEKELIKKLKLKGYSEESALHAAERLKALGLIDDTAFAAAFCEELVLRKGFGFRRVLDELFKKGIDRDIAEQAVSVYEFDSVAEIKAIIARKFTPIPDDDKGKRRMTAFLMRSGYGYSEIRSALNEIQSETLYEE